MEQHFALKRGKEERHSVKLTLLLLANLFTGQFKVDNSWYSRNPFPSKQSLSEPSWPTCKCKLVFSIYLSFFFFFLCSPPNQNNSQLIINIHVLWTHYIPTHQRPTHFQKARPSMHWVDCTPTWTLDRVLPWIPKSSGMGIWGTWLPDYCCVLYTKVV